jgi:hypothetical protein
MFLSACCASAALATEFLFAGICNWVGFGQPLRLLLSPGTNLYWLLVKRGFYAYPSGLLIDMGFALKFDLILNFLFFVWLLFSFPDFLQRWSPFKTGLRKLENKYFWLR